MAGQNPLSFGSLLRHLRMERGLTQEDLADAAGLSARSISDLERGVNLSARRETSRLLADSLGLEGQARADFEASARGQRTLRTDVPGIETVATATRTLPRDTRIFTGRAAELRDLTDQVLADEPDAAVQISAIDGMAGIGKTTFAIHAAHLLARHFPDGQIFLTLNGHTPGQRPVDPADALESLLLTTGVTADQIPLDLQSRARLWRAHLAKRALLLVLDDALGHEQIRPLLPGQGRNLVLVTSRRRLTSLVDARTVSLDTFRADEAAELFIRLAGRRTLDSTDPAVGEITRGCGFLPLAIGMLARQLHHHPSWQCAKLAADMAASRNRLEYMRAEDLSVTAAFDISYENLTAAQQRFFRHLGVHPGADIDAYAAAALDGSDLDSARRHLEDLYDQNLLTEPQHGRYRMHDLIRAHAWNLAMADAPHDRDTACARVLDYYAHTTVTAQRHLITRSPAGDPPSPEASPAFAPELLHRADATAWLTAERHNLHAAASYAATTDQLLHVVVIATGLHSISRRYGHWDQALRLYHVALAAARDLGNAIAEARVLTDLGDLEHLTGEYALAKAHLLDAVELYRRAGSDLGEASARNELGVVQETMGEYSASAGNHERALTLYRQMGNQVGEAGALDRLGVVQHTTGDYPGARASHEQALRLCGQLGDQFGEAGALNRLGAVQQSMGDYAAAVASHLRALALYRDLEYVLGQANALNRLGNAQYRMRDYAAATGSAQDALELYRALEQRIGEAHALNVLGTIQQATGHFPDALASHELALTIYRELGHPIGEARALHSLAAAYRKVGDQAAAVASEAKAGALYRRLGVGNKEPEDNH